MLTYINDFIIYVRLFFFPKNPHPPTSYSDPAHILTPYLLTLHLYVILPRGILNGIFPYDHPLKILNSFSISPILATCLVHYIFLDMIILMFGADYKLLNSSLWYFLRLCIMSFLSVPIFTPSPCF